MTLLEELKIFLKQIAHWFYALIAFAFFFYLFGLKHLTIYGRSFILPILSKNSLSVQMFKAAKRDLLPEGIQLIVTNPWGGFIAQLQITLVLAFIVTFPFLLYKVMRYSSPALFAHEKKAMFKTVIMFTALFVFGNLFAYYYMLPITFKFMYPFASSLGAVTFFSLDAFMSWVISILITAGVVFLLPVFMTVLSYLGLVSSDFWKEKWRFSFLSLLIFSAIITPDGTGITMMLLFAPLMVLYMGGSMLAGRL